MIANPNIASIQQAKPADTGEALLWAVDQRDARTLSAGLLNDGRNLRFSDGVPQTRKGVTKPAWANATTIGGLGITGLGTPYGSGVFRDPNGVEWQLVAAGGYVWCTCPHNYNTTVPIPQGVAIAGPCRFVQAFDQLFLFRGRYLAPLLLADIDTGFTDLLPQYDPTTVYNAAVTAAGQTADEMSYGPYQAVSALTWANGVATCVTVAPHGYVTGADVTIAGANENTFNGRFPITVVDGYTFTYVLSYVTVAQATGTIQVTNNAYYWTALGSTANITSLTQQVGLQFQLTSLTSPAALAATITCARTNVAISSFTKANGVATCISPNHGLVVGASVTITGATHAAYNGTFTVATVPDGNTFTYTLVQAPSGNETSTSATWSAAATLLATATTATAHGLTSGWTVAMSGANQTAYNVAAAVVTVLSATTFTYFMATVPSGAATGSPLMTPPNNTLATATRFGHGLTTGQSVTIAGAAPAGSPYNGTFNVTVLNSSQFTYVMTAGTTSPATGTITVTTTNLQTAVATTQSPHNFVTGDYVTISAVPQAAYNGTFSITVTGPNTFVYTMGSAPGANATAGLVYVAQTSRVLAGQTPDTNPSAWQRCYNILPNADTALFVNNLLLVPTAYEPSSVDNYQTFNGGSYGKVDFIVATNYEDYIHFTFMDEFRINQGGSDEIVDLFKFGSSSTSGQVVVLKDKSWALLSGITGDLSGVTLDVRSTEYGAAGPRSWAVVGSNAYFLSPTYGVMVIRQTDLGVMLSVNVPLSAPIQPTMDAIDWTKADTFRMSHWDNKLYLSVYVQNIGPCILVYDFKASVRMGNNVWESGVMTQGWAGLDTGSAMQVMEFHRLTLNGEDRHFFLDPSGYVNLMEESDCDDQVAGNGPQGLAWVPITTYALSRAYGASVKGLPRPTETGLSLATFNPCYTVQVVYTGVNNVTTCATNVTRSNIKYDRPFTAQNWNPTNINNDWNTPWREDYSVTLATVTGPNLVPSCQFYTQGNNYSCLVGLTVGATYLYTPGPNDAFLQCGATRLYGAGTFVATVEVCSLGMAPQPGGGPFNVLCTATVATFAGLNLGSGLVVDQFQEALDTRRVGRLGGKSYQVAITNTQGKMKLAGLRIDAEPGMDIKGPIV
jgi:hypothetical protein